MASSAVNTGASAGASVGSGAGASVVVGVVAGVVTGVVTGGAVVVARSAVTTESATSLVVLAGSAAPAVPSSEPHALQSIAITAIAGITAFIPDFVREFMREFISVFVIVRTLRRRPSV